MEEPLKWLAMAGGTIGIVSFLFTHFHRKSTSDLLIDVALLKKQMSLFWSVVEKEIGNMLHSPHREELDRLIEKNARQTLSRDEVGKFTHLLQQVVEDPTSTNGEKTAAIIMKAALLAKGLDQSAVL